MCSISIVVCAVSILCCVHFAVTTLVASLRGQNESWCADFLGRTFVEATDEIPPYIHIYIDVYVYIYGSRTFNGPPCALMGRALMRLLGPLSAGPSWSPLGPHGPGPHGPLGLFLNVSPGSLVQRN